MATTAIHLTSGALTHNELHDYSDDESRIRAYVVVDLDEMIGTSIEDFGNRLSQDITGDDEGLSDLKYEADGADHGGVILLVTGTIEWDNLELCSGADCTGTDDEDIDQ
jgi:hypothetical protein